MSDFDVGFQRALLRLMMVDESFNHKCMQYLNPGFFTTEALGWIFKAMQSHHAQYGMRCTDIPLREAVRRESQEKVALYGPEVEQVISLGIVPESDYVKDQLQDFVRRNMFARAHRHSMHLYNEGRFTECYDSMQQAMETIQQVEFDAPDRHWFFDHLLDRQRRRYQEAVGIDDSIIPTGIDILDDMIGGGVSVGEVFSVLSYPKVGKTTWLINRAGVATRALRIPTLYINLEGTTSLISDRLDAWFSWELYQNVKRGNINARAYREMLAEFDRLRKLLVIRTLNDWDVNVLHIEAELNELRALGFVPRLIVIDYIDLLRSRNKSAQSETQHQIDATKDVKRLATRGYAVWSAFQAQRPKLKKMDETPHLLRSQDAADAYGKFRIIDGYGSLNATREEREEGEMRLYWEGYRDAPVGKVIRLRNDVSRMRMGIEANVGEDDNDPEEFSDG